MKQAARQQYWWRHVFLLSVFLCMMVGVVARIAYLQFIENKFLQDQGNLRTIRTVTVHPTRGMIKDRHGEPLAVTTSVYSIWVNPKTFEANKTTLQVIANELQLSITELTNKLRHSSDREFVYLKRQVSPEIAQSLDVLQVPGLYSQREYRRYYPSSEVTAHVIGFTDVDDIGQEGMELAFDHWLRGRDGAKRVLKDRTGRIIGDIENIQSPEPGHDLTLSIDRRLQYLAYRELKAAVNQYNAVAGSLVILDVETGEVLAMVNQPSFNPNNRKDFVSSHVRNRAVTDTYEPGSVIKAFSMTLALESKQFEPHSLIDTNPGWIMVDNKMVRDIHSYGVLDLAGILSKSSNVGISKIILALEPNKLANLLMDFGFGQTTGSGFPGEQPGKIVIPHDNDRFTQSTQAFGYGVTVTTLQLAEAYATLGNFGIRKPTTFLKRETDTPPIGKRVVSQQTATSLLKMLSTVIAEGGSGIRAQVPGYRVTGKTGTARKVGANGYEADKHRAVFAGLIPASKPKLAMVVMIDEPRSGQYYGGAIAAPVFAKVMAGTVRLLDIPPDDLLAANFLTTKRG